MNYHANFIDICSLEKTLNKLTAEFRRLYFLR